MKRDVKFVRSVYWIGVVLDALSVLPFLWPAILLKRFGIGTPIIGAAVRFPAYIAGTLIAGWTTLLIWGALAPIKRRGTLIITAVPVMIGLIASSVYLGTVIPAGFLRAVPMIATQTVVFGLMVSAWVVAGKIAARNPVSEPGSEHRAKKRLTGG